MSSMTSQDQRVLVTGASGFIASHIVKLLLQKGYKVRGTVRSVKNINKVAPLRKLVPNPKHELELVEADLNNEAGWIEAVKDCDYVMHTASPFPNAVPKDEDEIVKPAVNGTLFVLRACVQEGSKVKRVVLTSSAAAIGGDFLNDDQTLSEKDWPDLVGLTPYTKSKYLAEKAAWDFVKERENNNQPCFELATINPGYVMGPLLHDSECTSTEAIGKIMNNEMAFLPDISMPVCDVRDVAQAHLKAMLIPECKNNRHLIVTSNDASSFKDWALILDAEFKPKGYKVPTKMAPNFMIKFAGLFDKTIRMITPILGKKPKFDNTRMRKVLRIEPIELKKTLIDMANSMIERNYIKKAKCRYS